MIRGRFAGKAATAKSSAKQGFGGGKKRVPIFQYDGVSTTRNILIASISFDVAHTIKILGVCWGGESEQDFCDLVEKEADATKPMGSDSRSFTGPRGI